MGWVTAYVLAKKYTNQQVSSIQIIQPKPAEATVFVAAYNAREEVKKLADYVCDGINDNVEILDAMNSLPASGGRVVLSEGEFVLGSTLSFPKDNITLTGVGYGTLVRCSVADCLRPSDHSTISNMKIDGIHNANPVYIPGKSYVTVENCYIYNAGNGIRMDGGSSYCTIRNCVFDSIPYVVINVLQSSNCHITDNAIINSNATAINLDGTVESCVIANNIIANNPTNGNGVALSGIQSTSDYPINNVVIGNTIKNCDKGIYVLGKDNIVIGNYCGDGNYGIYIDTTDSTNNLVVKNHVYNNTTPIYDGGSGTIFDGVVLNKGNASSVTVTETSETLKQSVTPDLNFMYYVDGVHVVANNPAGSGATLYFKVKAELSTGSEIELSSETVAEGNSFDSWLRWPYDSITNEGVVKSIKLYAYCSAAPASGYEPTVQLERVTGLQG